MSGTSPRKSLSVREAGDGVRALHKKVEKDRYNPIANFYFTIHTFVKFAAAFKKLNGYILNVHRTDGVSMKCFVLCDEIDSAKKFKAAINRTFSEKGGVFWQSCSDEQFSSYVMAMLHDFISNNGTDRRGTVIIGRQVNFRLVDDDDKFIDNDREEYIEEDDPRKKRDDFYSSVYVLNENTQINRDGVIPEEQWKYIWMVPYLRLIPSAQNDKLVKHYLQAHPHQVRLDIPVQVFDWHDFIGRAKSFFSKNFMPFMFFLSGGFAAFHCKRILNNIYCCPVTTAVGETASGKSTALKVTSKLMGMQIVSQSSGQFVISELTRCSIPLCWDDPTHPSILRTPLVSVFEGLGNQTKERGSEKPLTSFVLTVNFKLDDDLRSFERTTPIWFNKLANNQDEDVGSFLEARKKIFEAATTHSLFDIIKMGEEINRENLAVHIKYFKKHLSELSPRLSDIYAVYRLLAHEIITLVDDEDICSPASLDNYLETEFFPYVKAIYAVSVKTLTSVEDVFRLVMQAVEKLNLTKDDVGQWMRPKVKAKKTTQMFIVFILHTAIGVINDGKLADPPSDSNVRDLVAQVNGRREEFKSSFVGQPTKVSCLKVPRHIFSKDLLDQIDKLFEGEKPHEASVEECRQCTNQAREIEEREEMYRQEMQNVKDEYEAKIHRLSANLQAEVKERECQRISFQKELAGVNDKHQQALKELNALKEKCSTASNRCGGSIAQAFSGIAQDSKEARACANSRPSTSKSSCVEVAQTLDDSGIMEDLDDDDTTKSKRKAECLIGNKDICTICKKKKKNAGMIQCIGCKQWLHCSCVGIPIKEARKKKKKRSCARTVKTSWYIGIAQ